MLYQAVRPKTFDEVLGNKATVKALKTLCRKASAKRQHVILLAGPTGCGKTTLARILAKEFGADEFSTFELNASNTRGIDTIREIAENADRSVITGGARVYVVDESHQLTSQAQQAFLKVLEDSVRDTYFILCTTDPQNLIATIRGRCAEYTVGPLGHRDMQELISRTCKLIEFQVSADVAKAIAQYSEGFARNALVLLEKCTDLEEESDMLELVSIGTESEPAILDLCTILSMDPSKRKKVWKEAVSIVFESGTDSEGIRRSILGFLGSKMRRCKDEEIMLDYCYLVRKFSMNTFYHGKSLLAVLVTEACLGGS